MTTDIKNIPLKNLIKIEKIHLTHAENAARLCFTRKERFVEGYDCKTEQIRLLNEFFGDLGQLYSNGLIAQFKQLREKVIKENKIGLIIAGLNDKDTFINNYTQQDNTTILKLTASSITRTLLSEHFTRDEINKLCISTPNFEIYYNKDDEDLPEGDGNGIQFENFQNKNRPEHEATADLDSIMHM